ncbi:alpha/beta hydrolase [Nesterenkonia sp. LB17]|uniref:alpha/beta fold hydrolase n=1 Tax=Nesterenkonia sp. LB17 TaxID=2901230 RepID=UPI001F4C9993|nr:alpha/beta fold hydrolase [Nesterenkonia sp. LB17]MCH8565020.1 alpha/beta hydrolase [Nesterenkonia sp. LB17]
MRTAEQRSLNAVQRTEAYREVLIDSGGLPVALSVWDAGPGAPAVLFLPGTMTHPLFYEEFLDAVNRAGVTVVGLHPAGHGKSPRLHRRHLTFGDLIMNAVDAITWMHSQYAGAPVMVLGSSQGGVLALAVAARAPGVAAVFAHNVLDPALPATLGVTRAPTWLSPVYGALRRGIGVLGRVAPGAPVPFDAYLDARRVCGNPEVIKRFYTDPLGLRSYPLSLLAEMMTSELPGPARCPVVVIAATGDPLFDISYTRQVFQRIEAPNKELLVIDSDEHLIFTESLDVVLPVLVPRLMAAGAAGSESPRTSEQTRPKAR